MAQIYQRADCTVAANVIRPEQGLFNIIGRSIPRDTTGRGIAIGGQKESKEDHLGDELGVFKNATYHRAFYTSNSGMNGFGNAIVAQFSGKVIFSEKTQKLERNPGFCTEREVTHHVRRNSQLTLKGKMGYTMK
jgi:hypothetical protein